MTDLAALAGCRLQRIDGPRPDLLALTFHRADLHGTLVVSTRPGAVGWGWLDERPRGDPASSFVALLRKHLRNARLVDVAASPTGAGTLVLARGESTAFLRLESSPVNVVLVVDGVLRGAKRPSLLSARGWTIGQPCSEATTWTAKASHSAAASPRTSDGGLADSVEALVEQGPALLEAVQDGELDARRATLARGLRRRHKQLRRRLKAIEGDLARVDEVDGLRQRASLLLAHLHAIPNGAEEAVVIDWHDDPPVPLTIPIRPGRTPRQEAESLYVRARKLERGGEIALERHERTRAELERLDALIQRLTTADKTSLVGVAEEAARLGVRTPTGSGRRAIVHRLPFRTFRGHGGRPILVGRSAVDNDALTLRHARPWDHWLHARGVSGSHVVVPLDREEACPPELLADAAHLAAHFSRSRGETRVEVQHLARRYVRKLRGAAPGAVTLQREKVLLLQVEPKRLERLLDSEDA